VYPGNAHLGPAGLRDIARVFVYVLITAVDGLYLGYLCVELGFFSLWSCRIGYRWYIVAVLPEPCGPLGGADLHFCCPQSDTSLRCETTDTGLVNRVVCMLTSQPLDWYQIILLGNSHIRYCGERYRLAHWGYVLHSKLADHSVGASYSKSQTFTRGQYRAFVSDS